jgi:hypothetical protein
MTTFGFDEDYYENADYDPFKRKEPLSIAVLLDECTLIATAKRSKTKKDPKARTEKVLLQKVADEGLPNQLTPSSNIHDWGSRWEVS